MNAAEIVERELAQLDDIFAAPILQEIRKVQVAYRLDWGRNPELLELGMGQWAELTAFIYQQDASWRECLTNDYPTLWGMRLVPVPQASGLMAK